MIKAPNLFRLKEFVDLWDLGRHTTLRDELIQGRDFIVMQTEVTQRPSGGLTYLVLDSTGGGSRQWTRSSSPVAKGAQVWCSTPSWTLPPRRVTPVVPERNPGTRPWLLNPESPLDPVLTDPRGATLGQSHPGRKRDSTVPCVH